MKAAISIFLFLFCMKTIFAQPLYQELPSIPEAVTNNAVAAATVQDTPYIYSFAGLDSTKIWSGVHLKSWQLNTITGQWSTLPPVPDTMGGKIAASASRVHNIIYVIGGYHVAEDDTEISSKKVHRFDTGSTTWLSDAADIPIAIDDQVQVVWRDSLIFVVTGWSNTQNVPAVQIFNPAENSWTTGTALPNNSSYKSFGATGVIIGDTLYYAGGASTNINFPATSYFRKGYINPDNPSEISWTGYSTAIAKGYRMAAGSMNGAAVWIGGSDVTYNYDGIAYNGSGGVSALMRRKIYSPENGIFSNEMTALLPAIMDVRGAAQLDTNRIVSVGGMEPGQQVSRKVYSFSWENMVATSDQKPQLNVYISPNPASEHIDIQVDGNFAARLFSADGHLINTSKCVDIHRLSTEGLAAGVYLLNIEKSGYSTFTKQVVIH